MKAIDKVELDHPVCLEDLMPSLTLFATPRKLS